jgi:hypothetical protein
MIFLHNSSQVSIYAYFKINGCYNINLAVILFYGYFCNAFPIKSLTEFEPVYITNFYVTIFDISDFLVILNGF